MNNEARNPGGDGAAICFDSPILPASDLPRSVAAALEAAIRIVIRDGYARLTMRRIADEAGISLGTLSYRFPDKSMMIAQAFDLFIDGEVERVGALPSRREAEPRAALEASVANHARIALDPRIRRFNSELRAFAQRDAHAREMLDRVGARVRDIYAEGMMRAVPGLDRREALVRAAIIQTLIAGLPVTLAEGPARAPELAAFEADAVAAAMLIATRPPEADRGPNPAREA